MEKRNKSSSQPKISTSSMSDDSDDDISAFTTNFMSKAPGGSKISRDEEGISPTNTEDDDDVRTNSDESSEDDNESNISVEGSGEMEARSDSDENITEPRSSNSSDLKGQINAQIESSSGNESSDSDAAAQASEDGDSETECTAEYENLRSVIADMSFEELQTLKEKVGTKMFNLAMSKAPIPSKQKISFKRENKNRPRETTAKKPVGRYRAVIEKKKKVHRDPRFDDISGEYNETYFNQAYSFIGDVKQREKQKLMKLHKKEADPEKKAMIEKTIKRLVHQEKEKSRKEDAAKKEKLWRDKQKEMIKKGKQPFYLKKSAKKELELAGKYNDLMKTGKVDNYMAKKRKKNAIKERKKLPNRT